MLWKKLIKTKTVTQSQTIYKRKIQPQPQTKIQKDNVFKGQCPVCKTVVFSKQHSENATFMKIFKQ